MSARPEPPSDRPGGPPDAGFSAVLLLLSSVTLFCTGYVLAVSAPDLAYSWDHDMISDLGRATCRTWEGHWVCSPRAVWFNVCLAGSGASGLGAAFLLRAYWGRTLGVGITALSIGLLWLAVFPSDGPLPLHMVGAIIALPVACAGVFASGIRPDTEWLQGCRTLRTGLGLLGLVLCLDHIAPPPAPMPRGAAETVTVLLLLALLVVESARCYLALKRPGPGKRRRRC